MAEYKLKKGRTLGALAAESDVILGQAFVDNGYIDQLEDCEDPHFLILGRTGSGKTALLKYLSGKLEHQSKLDPDELSMQYIHSNTVLTLIASWGVHLDIFFKFLWRHICILELIKLRYQPERGKRFVETFRNFFSSERSQTQAQALQYLEEHGQEYWVTADTHVKHFTSELATKITSDNQIGASIAKGTLSYSDKSGTSEVERSKVESTVVQRAQQIVNDHQVAALNELIDELEKKAFDDPKKKYFLIVDDLDKNWMPENSFYSELIKSLLYTVKEVNQRLSGVKILIAIRSNIYYRIFRSVKINEPQLEKWADNTFEILWSRSEMIDFLNKRLAEVFRGQYTSKPPTVDDIMPIARPQNQTIRQKAIDYILDRTLMRPRDVLAFVNMCIERNNGSLPITWTTIFASEEPYSRQRLESLVDEWKDSFLGSIHTFEFLRSTRGIFRLSNLEDSIIDNIFLKNDQGGNEKCAWLNKLQDSLLNGTMSYREIKYEIINGLFLMGMIGIKRDNGAGIIYSYEASVKSARLSSADFHESSFHVHKMFQKGLGI